jgi:RNase P subunit RPR2
MAIVVSLRDSAHQVTCDECGEVLIAPEWAEYFSEEGIILYLWSCPHCGHRFETEAILPAEVEPEPKEKVLEDFFTSLLVA